MTILGKDTVQQSAKGESVTQEATPEYKLETTPGGDKGGNTGSSDANANEGGGSQAGGSAQSQASKQLATEKESAKMPLKKQPRTSRMKSKAHRFLIKKKQNF
ncbi:LPXTG-motif cell wall anchor domain [Streptococcus pneumoniae]|nr:LPXTG-motif cell wall anchor domain [Streptococcus pneumoniae]